ncbi:hypothetical protein AMJ80_09390 [bacterium SM23_31]|nr:MAG: hypothetical protein AMJ80_09390 [bacterium SM23_31]
MDGSKKHTLSIFKAGIEAVEPRTLIKRMVKYSDNLLTVRDHDYDLSRFKKVIVAGGGKASTLMARGIEEILQNRITDGLVITSYGSSTATQRVRIVEAGHPVPDENGVKGAAEMLEMLEASGEDTLVICVISGGASALLTAPHKTINVKHLQVLTHELLACGASIKEINTVRKHLSRIKGGNLAKAANPATVVTLILSDVVGNPLDVIASGPTVPDPTTYSNAMEVLGKYGLLKKTPISVIEHLEKGASGEIPETPKPGDPLFSKVKNFIIGSNRAALKGAEKKAEELGYNTLLLSSSIEGETRDAAMFHASIVKEIIENNDPVAKPACLLSGGETTVTIHGTGKGGRNQEFVLALAIELDGAENVSILSGGTDGIDGPTDAAGALADGGTCQKALTLGLEPHQYFDNNDSYSFFKALDDLIITGPTNTNVMDLRIILVGSKLTG